MKMSYFSWSLKYLREGAGGFGTTELKGVFRRVPAPKRFAQNGLGGSGL